MNKYLNWECPKKLYPTILFILLLVLISFHSPSQSQEIKGTPEGVENTIASEKENIKAQIGEKKIDDLFQRDATPISGFHRDKFGEEIIELTREIRSLISIEFWKQRISTVQKYGFFQILILNAKEAILPCNNLFYISIIDNFQ